MLSIKEVSIIDDSISTVDFSKLHLSVQVSLDRFSYAIIYKDFRKYLVLESYFLGSNTEQLFDENLCKESIKNIYGKEILLRENFSSVSYSFVDRDFLLFPDEYFDDSKKDCYLEILTDGNKSKQRYKINKIDNLGIKYIYYDYKDIRNFLENVYGDGKIKFNHSSEIFINKVLMADNNGVFINIFSFCSFEILIKKKDSHIDFYNHYDFETDEEAFYLIHSVLLEYNISYFEDVYIFGNIYEGSYIYEYLSKNIKNVFLPEVDKSYLYSLGFVDFPFHRFYTLLSQYK